MSVIDWKDKERAKEHLKRNGMLLHGAPDYVKDDAEMIFAAVYDCEEAVGFASDRLMSDLSFLLDILHYGVRLPFSYKKSPLQDNEEAMGRLSEEYAPIIQQASQRLLNNEEYLKGLINNNLDVYLYVPEYINDKAFLIDLFKKEARLASVLPYGKYGDDKDIMLSCIHCYPYYYNYIDSSLKKDMDILSKLFRHQKAYRYLHPDDRIAIGLRFKMLPNDYWKVRNVKRR